jgi:glycosyltransferase involved in cell wall biosynthesis
MRPLVSILIPCYNAAPWLAKCIESALEQTYRYKEVIVVDDGSRDGSLDIIRRFEGRIRWETGPNRGANATRNRLMALSSGEWLSFLDADDYLLPHKVEKQVDLVYERRNVDVVYSPCFDLYDDPERGADGGDLLATYPFVDEDVFANYFRWTCFSTTALLFRASAIADVGGWNENAVCHEHELILRLLFAKKQFALMPERLAVYRVQYLNSISRSSPLRTRMDQMALSDRLEADLAAKGEMTENRRIALAQARILAARSAYSLDKNFSRRICAKALSMGPFVRPQPINKYYWYALQTLGFDFAELLAKVSRGLAKR